jgi:DNA-binding XRE family transcriptional regulator
MTDISSKQLVAFSRRMATRESGGKWNERAVRLRVLRCAMFKETMSQFARRLKVSPQRLNNMESGFPLSIDVANKMRLAVPGITLDWLYHGVELGVPHEIIMRLRAEAAKPDYTPPQ